MVRLCEEAEEPLGRDDGRLRVDEGMELEGGAVEEGAVEDDVDGGGGIVHHGEGRDRSGSDTQTGSEPLGRREGEAARAEQPGEILQVERLLLGEDHEPGGAAPLLEEEVLAVRAGHVRGRDLRGGHGEDRLVPESRSLDADPPEEREQPGRVERAARLARRFLSLHGSAF